MDLILWRHAEAEDTTPDLARALTPKGQKQARRMAEWLDAQLPEGCRILVSPAVRTQQTAEPLGRKCKTVDALAPGAGPEDVLRAANWPNSKEPVLVVGHQPTLGQVAALLVSGAPQYWDMKKASVWWLTQKDGGTTVVKAVMTAEMLGKQK